MPGARRVVLRLPMGRGSHRTASAEKVVTSLCDVSLQAGSMRCSRVECVANGLCTLGKVAHAEHVSGVARGEWEPGTFARRSGLTSAKAVRCATNQLHLSPVARARFNAKNALVLAHLGLVDQCVRALHVQGELIEDATQDGRVALMRAAESFDTKRGTPFGPYARMFVVGAIKGSMSRDCGVHVPRGRVAAGEEKPKCVQVSALHGATSSHSEADTLRGLDEQAVARAAVGLPRTLRRAAISMLSGVNPTEHARRYLIPRQTASDHYRKAREELCKMFR